MSDHDELSVEVDLAPDAATVRCGGRLTLTSASHLRRTVKELLPRTRHIVIDFSNITMMDSVGLGTVAALYASARTAGCELQLMNIRPRIREIFSVARVLSLFEPCGSSNIRVP